MIASAVWRLAMLSLVMGIYARLGGPDWHLALGMFWSLVGLLGATWGLFSVFSPANKPSPVPYDSHN